MSYVDLLKPVAPVAPENTDDGVTMAPVTPVTPGYLAEVTDKSLITKTVTPVTPVTPANNDSQVQSPTEGEPSNPCPACGGGHFYLADLLWWCSQCDPADGLPQATLSVTGGRLPTGTKQDIGAAIRAAVADLPIDADEFRAWLDADDLKDVAAGRIPAATLRAYAVDLIKRGPRDLGATVGGVRVGLYTKENKL